MTAPITAASEVEQTYEPTPAQKQRERELKRFNRLFVYAPMILVGLLLITLFVLMLWGVFANSPESNFYRFLSGLADLIIIMNVVPMMLLCLVGPALLFFLVRSTYKRQQLEPSQRRSKLQVLLWRLDGMLATLRDNLRDNYLKKGVRPLIIGHAVAATVQAIARYVQNIFWKRKD